jgi:hypothetical protein
MATIINTLEVVLEPPRQVGPPGGGSAPEPSSTAAPPLTPADLADVAERRARYVARLVAH